MILNDQLIQVMSKHEELITPFNPAQLNPSSYDLTLSDLVVEPVNVLFNKLKPSSVKIAHIDPEEDQANNWSEPRHFDEFLLYPDEFVLFSTVEKIKLPPTIRGSLHLKSSRGRVGLEHSHSCYIDPGFEGFITLELTNINNRPIILRPGMRIVQIEFAQLIAAAMKDYSKTGRYRNQSIVPQFAKGEKK